MKTFKSILIIIVVLSLTLTVLGGVKTNTEKKQSTNLVNLEETKEFCYIWNAETGDRAILSIKQTKENIEGEFKWFPFEKDSKVGIFKGSILKKNNYQVVDAIWEVETGGIITKEELKILLKNNIAKVRFGEIKQRTNGIYAYIFPKRIFYNLDLTQINCGEIHQIN